MMMKFVFRLIPIIALVLFFYDFQTGNKDKAKRVFYVNSYHQGYGSSDDVMEGINETLAGKDIELKTFFLDAKRKSSPEEIEESAKAAKAQIDEFDPDLLIVSDDNAVQSLVVPYFNNTAMPVVFCGVNWSAEQYQLGKNVTGMLEVLPLRECIVEMKKYAIYAKKLVILSENSVSEQNNKTLLDTLYRNMGLEPQYDFAEDFGKWKALFLEANQTADLIYMSTNGGIKNWDKEEASEFVRNNIKIPVFTCDDFMMPYCVFGMTKVAREQGEWVARTALEILDGKKKPSQIPFARNSKVKIFTNKELLEKIGLKITDKYK